MHDERLNDPFGILYGMPVHKKKISCVLKRQTMRYDLSLFGFYESSVSVCSSAVTHFHVTANMDLRKMRVYI